jgi:hypothetical protein
LILRPLGYEQYYRSLWHLTSSLAVVLSCAEGPPLARCVRTLSARLAESRSQIR